VCSVPQSEMVPSSPASSPTVCISHGPNRGHVAQAGTPDTIPARQLLTAQLATQLCRSAFERCWRSCSEADIFCLLCLSSGVPAWGRARGRDLAHEMQTVGELARGAGRHHFALVHRAHWWFLQRVQRARLARFKGNN